MNSEITSTGTNKRYCTSCQVMRPAEYGKMITSGKVTRWKCTACTLKINDARYKSMRKSRHE